MRKAFFALLPFFLLPLLFFSSCQESAESLPLADYRISAELSDNRLTVSTDVTYSCPSEGLSAVKLRLFPNAYLEGNRTVGESKIKAAYPKGASYGGCEILSLSSSEGVKDYSIGGDDKTVLTVRLGNKLPKGKRISLHIEETVTLCAVKHRLGYYGGYYNLTGFYPVLCPFEEGKYRADPYYAYGDPFLFDAANFSLSLSLPAGYQAAASALPLSRETEKGKTVFSFSLERARDFAVIASNKLQYKETEAASIPIRYYYETDKKADETLAVAAKAVEVFSRTFGAYPYPSLTLACAPFFESGMEYSGLALLSNELSSSAKKETAIHEIAHQWWFGKVHTDQIVSPWIDEGLSEYATALYYKETGASSAFRAKIAEASEAYSIYSEIKGEAACRLSLPLSDLADGYAEIAYCKSLLLFITLAEKYGYERLNAALRDFADRFAYKRASANDLISALSASLKEDQSEFFSIWLFGALPAPY